MLSTLGVSNGALNLRSPTRFVHTPRFRSLRIWLSRVHCLNWTPGAWTSQAWLWDLAVALRFAPPGLTPWFAPQGLGPLGCPPGFPPGWKPWIWGTRAIKRNHASPGFTIPSAPPILSFDSPQNIDLPSSSSTRLCHGSNYRQQLMLQLTSHTNQNFVAQRFHPRQNNHLGRNAPQTGAACGNFNPCI